MSSLLLIIIIIITLQLTIIEPFNNPQEFIEFGISPPRGILIHGPPGVGKTMLCCAIAAETGLNCMFVECSQIRSKVIGESEKKIAKMFSQARANSPCILFIDQVSHSLQWSSHSNKSSNINRWFLLLRLIYWHPLEEFAAAQQQQKILRSVLWLAFWLVIIMTNSEKQLYYKKVLKWFLFHRDGWPFYLQASWTWSWCPYYFK